MKKKKGKQYIVGYVRESTREQAVNGFNLVDQQKRIDAYCTALFDFDYDLKIVIEPGASAKNLRRNNLQKLLDNISKVDILIIYSLDRLTRSIKDLIYLLEILEKNNVKIISISEKLDTSTSHGRFFIHMLGILAQLEREQISERTKRGLLESYNQGNWTSKVPFGYKRENKKLRICEHEAEIVKTIFNLAAIQKMNNYQIYLYCKNNYKDYKWSHMKIGKILKCKIYIGDAYLHNHEIKNHSPAIISDALFDQVSNVIKTKKKRVKYNYLFKNAVYCENCKMFHKQESCFNSQNNLYKYYICPSCKNRVSETKIVNTIYMDLLEIIVKEIREDEYNKFLNKLSKITNEIKTLEYIKTIHANESYDFGIIKLVDKLQVQINDISNIENRIKKILINTDLASYMYKFIVKYTYIIAIDGEKIKIKKML